MLQSRQSFGFGNPRVLTQSGSNCATPSFRRPGRVSLIRWRLVRLKLLSFHDRDSCLCQVRHFSRARTPIELTLGAPRKN